MALQLAEKSNGVFLSLQSMGYQQQYIQRAITVHNKSKLGTNYDVSIMVEIISRLKYKDKQDKKRQQNVFKAHFTQSEALKLKLNDKVDFRFENGRFILCKIIGKQGNMILVHPLGHPITITKHDRYCNVYSEYYNLASSKSISLRNNNNLKYKIDDYIDCNPIYRQGHKGWKYGRIIKIDNNSSQIKVFYSYDNRYHSYWFHVENTFEIAPYNSKCKPFCDNIYTPDIKENIEMQQSPSPPAKSNEPKYSFFYDSIQSQMSNDVLYSGHGHGQLQQDIINQQLHTFGYNTNDIQCAVKHVPNPKDINDIVGYITDHNDDSVVHQEWDMFEEDAISEMDDDEKREFEESYSQDKADLDLDYVISIPNLLIKLKNALFKNNAHLIEGIFAIQTNKKQIQQVINKINNNNLSQLELDGMDGILIANLIIIWYKQLPSPILNNIDIKQIEKCKIMNMAGILIQNEMEEPNESYYKWLLDLCIDITKHEGINKMSIKKLSSVIAPNLYPSNSDIVAKFLQLSILWRHFKKNNE